MKWKVFQHRSSSGISVKIQQADGIRSFIRALHELSYKEECFLSGDFLPVTVLITDVQLKIPKEANSQRLLTSVFKVGTGKSVLYSQQISGFVAVCVFKA